MKKVILFILLVFLLMPSVFAQSKKESGIPDWETFKKENPDWEKLQLSNGANPDNNLMLEIMKFNQENHSKKVDVQLERKWIQKKSGKSMMARYVGQIDETVVLKRSFDQKIVEFPIVDLDDDSKEFCGRTSIIRFPQTEPFHLLTAYYMTYRIEDDVFPKSWLYEPSKKYITDAKELNKAEFKKETLLKDWRKLTDAEKESLANCVVLCFLQIFGRESSNVTNTYEDEFFITPMERMLIFNVNNYYHIYTEDQRFEKFGKIPVFALMMSVMNYAIQHFPDTKNAMKEKFPNDVDMFDLKFIAHGMAMQEIISEFQEKSK